MSKKKSIGFFTIYLSRRYYLNEVPVEGKANSKFFRRLGMYREYISQILRTGNCISLISTPITIEEESFWNTNHFEDLAKYVFWTFNRSFLLKLLANVEAQKSPLLLRCRELLLENPVAYNEPPPADADDELLFCYRKHNSMKKYEYYAEVQALDEQNRKEFLGAVEKRIAAVTNPVQPTSNTIMSLLLARLRLVYSGKSTARKLRRARRSLWRIVQAATMLGLIAGPNRTNSASASSWWDWCRNPTWAPIIPRPKLSGHSASPAN